MRSQHKCGSIWSRHIISQASRIFILFLGCFFFLYALVDYSIKMREFSEHGLGVLELLLYYLCDFSKRIPILLPIALMLGTIKTLHDLNSHHELMAMRVGGVSLKNLVRPLLKIALICTLISYANYEWLLPRALDHLEQFEDRHRNPHGLHAKAQLNRIALPDGSHVLYQSYLPSRQEFFDVYWLHADGKITQMKYLYPFKEVPEGHYVNHIARNGEGYFVKGDSSNRELFSRLDFDKNGLHAALVTPENLAISTLWHNLGRVVSPFKEQREATLTWLILKLTMPWICLLAVIAPTPYCTRFNRRFPIFFVYGGSVIFLVTLFTLLDAAMILGEAGVLSPFIGIGAPVTTFFLFFGAKYRGME